ncbi:unnamed protein product (macronuclear) [Paramecium tetraurelia]|uniref:RGS domain-containing protein n=1 Tax=Paramecium tetraurelia TaxID=5888 RepID=A0C245_PARTE|nr:uncharacterized protein GSPATT00034339001 [Paramecium tetraurelia]CAK64862.1 unnamed protein product [Paramecium tetraurelia]|eukprot:XP_001432259.1 hypothetical protein (macronuclear) [Paramecium tetraurelia strain d4-2]
MQLSEVPEATNVVREFYVQYRLHVQYLLLTCILFALAPQDDSQTPKFVSINLVPIIEEQLEKLTQSELSKKLFPYNFVALAFEFVNFEHFALIYQDRVPSDKYEHIRLYAQHLA